MEDESFVSGLVKPEDAEEEEEEGEEPGKETTIISAASNGSVDRLKELLADGADVNGADEEGRTALHWSAGYSEIECMKALIEGKTAKDVAEMNDQDAIVKMLS